MERIPRIRLKSDDIPWNHKRLIDCCTLFTDGDWIEAKDQSSNGIRLIQTGNVGVTRFLDKGNSAKWISEETFNRLHCEEIYPGDILVSRLPEPAGRACILPNTGNRMITAVDCTIIRTTEDVDNDFLVQYLSTDKYFNEVNVRLAGGTRQRISRGNLSTFEIPFPNSLKEQQWIGRILSVLDYTFTLHQRKLDTLISVRKSMLQKMFPRNGSKVPEIRFKGFEGEWEERPFGALFRERRDKTETEYEDTLLSCAIDGMYLNSELFDHFRGSSTIGYLKVKKNDLILSAQNLHLGNANVNLRFDSGIISPAYKVYDIVECDPYFIQTWVKQEDTKRFFLAATTEGASACRKNIEWDVLYQQTLYVPTLPEQLRIGIFFKNLDNYIALTKAQIDTLKKVKRSLLTRMFA